MTHTQNSTAEQYDIPEISPRFIWFYITKGTFSFHSLMTEASRQEGTTGTEASQSKKIIHIFQYFCVVLAFFQYFLVLSRACYAWHTAGAPQILTECMPYALAQLDFSMYFYLSFSKVKKKTTKATQELLSFLAVALKILQCRTGSSLALTEISSYDFQWTYINTKHVTSFSTLTPSPTKQQTELLILNLRIINLARELRTT